MSIWVGCWIWDPYTKTGFPTYQKESIKKYEKRAHS